MRRYQKIFLILIVCLVTSAVFLMGYNGKLNFYDGKLKNVIPINLIEHNPDVVSKNQDLIIDATLSPQKLVPTNNTQNEKQFVYLVETEQCIPEKYVKKETLGDSVECMCDVIVFSFKHKCLNYTALSHVEYIEPQASTWAGGRNILYNAAISRNKKYLYYIFMDDDVLLYYNSKYAPIEMQSISPWRAFERFLIGHEPVVGATNYQFHHDSEAIIQSFHKICSPHMNPNENLPSNRTSLGTELPLYLTVFTFDGMLNAYHRDAVLDLLPYTLSYDYQNWNFAQLFQFAKVELMYRGQAVMFTPVNAENPLHREYPNDVAGVGEMWGKVIRDIAQDIPSEYSNEPWIKQFSDDPILYKDNISLTFCYKFPPKHHIRKYSHFSLKWTE